MSDAVQPRPDEVRAAFQLPFDPFEVKWKPQKTTNNRAMAICYVDARVVQDRLDEVVGVDGWQTRFTVLDNGKGSVECQLTVRIGGEWVTKADVGSPSEQPDEGDRMKAAFSDALKRAAIHYGIGRYLYRLPAQWVDYDPAKKRLVQVPQLPAWALPPKANPEVMRERAAAIDGLIRVVAERAGKDYAKALPHVLDEYKVKTLAELRPADADQLLQRLGAKVADLAKQQTNGK